MGRRRARYRGHRDPALSASYRRRAGVTSRTSVLQDLGVLLPHRHAAPSPPSRFALRGHMSASSPSHPFHPPLGRTALRPAWRTLPDPVRDAIAERLPAPVIAVADQGGGFTPGVAAQLRLADGSAV